MSDFDEESLSIQFQATLSISEHEGQRTQTSDDTSEEGKEFIEDDIKFIDNLLKDHENEVSQNLISPILATNDPKLHRFNSYLNEYLKQNDMENLPVIDNSSKTLVVLSSHSIRHKFNRNWVTKNYLSTIFEKPERLLSSCIGISAAVTLLPNYFTVSESIEHKSLYQPHVVNIHGRKWCETLYKLCAESQAKLDANELEVPADWNSGDIYLTPETIDALESVIGTIETTIDSIYTEDYKMGFMAIRPPGHHSHSCVPSGFCLINNVQIAVEYAALKYEITHAAIIDIDLHHGDGSQDICFERSGFKSDFTAEDEDNETRNPYGKKPSRSPKVGYFSMHDVNSFPTELNYATKENIKNASLCIMNHDLNIWNIHLSSWATEDDFYKTYVSKYLVLLDKVREFLISAKQEYELALKEYETELTKITKPDMKLIRPEFKPVIFISAGFDASEYENPKMQRHGVNVPTSFYYTFTQDIIKFSKEFQSDQIKIVSMLEGGYSDGALTSGIFSHLFGLNSSDMKWDNSNGDKSIITKLTKGCKKSWKPHLGRKVEKLDNWCDCIVNLGRLMIPNLSELMKPVVLNGDNIDLGERKTRSYFKTASKNPTEE